MSVVIDSVDIKGLRATHFEQLQWYMKQATASGYYYGNAKQFKKREADINNWLRSIITALRGPDVVVPRKKGDAA